MKVLETIYENINNIGGNSDAGRLFSCGTSEDGESFLVEWNESEGAIRRTFLGFRAKSNGVVQFDTTQNRFMAAGEDHQIKFWDMNNIEMLTSTEAEGGLLSPSIEIQQGRKFSVSTTESGFKILANTEGIQSLRALKNRSFEGLRSQNGSSGIKIPISSVAANAPKMEQPDRNSPERPLHVDRAAACLDQLCLPCRGKTLHSTPRCLSWNFVGLDSKFGWRNLVLTYDGEEDGIYNTDKLQNLEVNMDP